MEVRDLQSIDGETERIEALITTKETQETSTSAAATAAAAAVADRDAAADAAAATETTAAETAATAAVADRDAAADAAAATETTAAATETTAAATADDSFSDFFTSELGSFAWTVDELQQLQQLYREGKRQEMLAMKRQKEIELIYPSKGELFSLAVAAAAAGCVAATPVSAAAFLCNLGGGVVICCCLSPPIRGFAGGVDPQDFGFASRWRIPARRAHHQTRPFRCRV